FILPECFYWISDLFFVMKRNNKFFMTKKRIFMRMQRFLIFACFASMQLIQTIDDVISESLTRRPTKTIHANLHVLGKTILRKHVRLKQGATITGKLKVAKLATFHSDVNVEGTLSVVDLVISGSVIGIIGV